MPIRPADPGEPPDDGHSAEVASWLADVARRTPLAASPAAAPAADEPPEVALEYLERLTGQRLRSRGAIDAYLRSLVEDEQRRASQAARSRIVREGLLLMMLTAGYLHYYYWDVQLQIHSIPQVNVFVPMKPAVTGQRT